MTVRSSRSLVSLLVLLFATGSSAGSAPTSSDSWQLSEQCPPGFLLDASGICLLVTLYRDYNSQQSLGVGGLRTGLPPLREGFTPQEIDLGRLLFFDPILSADNTIACASCHHPDKGFSDGRAQSVGIKGHRSRRSAPTLWNVGFQSCFSGMRARNRWKNR